MLWLDVAVLLWKSKENVIYDLRYKTYFLYDVNETDKSFMNILEYCDTTTSNHYGHYKRRYIFWIQR